MMMQFNHFVATCLGFVGSEECFFYGFRDITEVEYPLLRACSSSEALTATGFHTHARTRRTSSDPAYLHTYVYLYMKRREEECSYFRTRGLKRTFGERFH